MSRRSFLSASLALPMALSAGECAFSRPDKDQAPRKTERNRKRPNIVLILADDMGFGDLGFFGNPDVQTPALDDMARDSVCLTQHYSAAPICAPSRASLLTGMYPQRTGQAMCKEWRGISPKVRTIGRYFKEAGYATSLVGKWHLQSNSSSMSAEWPWWPQAPENAPWNMGFDECVMCPAWSYYWKWALSYNGTRKDSDGRYLTDALTDEAIGFIDRHKNEPFFLYLAYNAPHFPLESREEDTEVFRRAGNLSEGVCRTYGLIRRMDYGIARVLEALKQRGLEENTIVIFTSDNGPSLGVQDGLDQKRYNGYLNGGKALVLDGGIRVPAMIRWPAGLPGGMNISQDLIHSTDWVPTLLAAAGMRAPKEAGFDGVNVLPVLRGERHDLNVKRFWSWNCETHTSFANTAMRDGAWKLYRPFSPEISGWSWDPPIPRDKWPQPKPAQLFRMDVDPLERNDVAAHHPDRVRRMGQEIDRWSERCIADYERAIANS